MMAAVVVFTVLCGLLLAWEGVMWVRRQRMAARQDNAWERGFAHGRSLRRRGRGVPQPGGQLVTVPFWGDSRKLALAFNRQMAYLDGRLYGWRDEDKYLWEYQLRCEAEHGVQVLERWANR